MSIDGATNDEKIAQFNGAIKEVGLFLSGLPHFALQGEENSATPERLDEFMNEQVRGFQKVLGEGGTLKWELVDRVRQARSLLFMVLNDENETIAAGIRTVTLTKVLLVFMGTSLPKKGIATEASKWFFSQMPISQASKPVEIWVRETNKPMLHMAQRTLGLVKQEGQQVDGMIHLAASVKDVQDRLGLSDIPQSDSWPEFTSSRVGNLSFNVLYYGENPYFATFQRPTS